MENISRRNNAHRMAMIAGLMVLSVLTLAGCGTAVGAGAGAYAGNQISHGSAAGTAAGAVGGGILGHVLTGN